MDALRIGLRPSLQLACFIVASHVLAAGAVWFSALPWWVCLAADAAVLVSLWRCLRCHYLSEYRQLHHRAGTWVLVKGNAEEPVELVGEVLVTSWLMILRFAQASGKTLSLVLPPDSAEADQLRRLRVLLRYGLN